MVDVIEFDEEVYSINLFVFLKIFLFFLREINVVICYIFQFGRSQSYWVVMIFLVDDGGKGKDGVKLKLVKKFFKFKVKKKVKKENLEDLKKELEIVRRVFYC